MDNLLHVGPASQDRPRRGDRRSSTSGHRHPPGLTGAPILFTTYLSGIFNEVESACPGVKALSFVDDVAWWTGGKDEQEVARKLEKAAGASLE